MIRILITGGKGFFATRLIKQYSGKYEILAIGKEEVDIREFNKLMIIVRKFKPDYIIHTAAIAVTDFCNAHPDIAYDINVNGTINVAKACKEVNAKLIFMSSEQVFNGNIEAGPYDENHVAVPDTEYGKSKLEAEGILKEMLDDV